MPVRHLEELLDTEIHRFELPDELDADRARRKQRSPRRILRAASDIVIPER